MNKIIDWQSTQNEEYLNSSRRRLNESHLIWVKQFIDHIKAHHKRDSKDRITSININDFGCNVGHFYRGCQDYLEKFSYTGYDISETYLSVAKSSFKLSKFFEFKLLDFSYLELKHQIKQADISVISATLEHILDFQAALKNIFNATTQLVLLRTFVGSTPLMDYCLTEGAKSEYLIRQFTLDDLIEWPKLNGWKVVFFGRCRHWRERKICV